MYISKGLLVWLVVSSLIVYLDAFYILNRPETLKGGKYYWFFQPYQLYVQFDTLYGANDNPFVFIIAWLNAIESTICFIGLILYSFKSRSIKLTGVIICLVVSIMVLWKTIIYMWYDLDWLSPQAGNFSLESIGLYYIPNGFWLVFPFLVIMKVSK